MNNIDNIDIFLTRAMKQLCGIERSNKQVKVLDFGCGQGNLVDALIQRGFDAYGCDIENYWQISKQEVLKTIIKSPYQLPFDTNAFDFVVSTSVLEHAQNKKECFREIHRVLKPGGYSMHLYPGKWYIPYEPHIYVPLLNFFYPYYPKWWLSLWAILGVRNEFQKKTPWKQVVTENLKYCRTGLSYWTTQQYCKLSLRIFGNCLWPMEFYIENSSGGFARFFKKLPFKTFSGFLSREMRTAFMIQQKMSQQDTSSEVSR